jgi:hypothetical protein
MFEIKMKQYTDKEIEYILDKAGFPKGLSANQMLRIAYWSTFNRKRLNVFCWNIERGKSLHFAFKDSTEP